MFAAQQAVLGDTFFQEAMSRRGITDLSSVVIYPWTAGYRGPEDAASQGRFIRMEVALAEGPEDNYYVHPVEGVIATIELDTMSVRIEDYGVVPVPTYSGNYTRDGIRTAKNVPSFPDGVRSDVKAISITQPEGTSFQVDGHEVRWLR